MVLLSVLGTCHIDAREWRGTAVGNGRKGLQFNGQKGHFLLHSSGVLCYGGNMCMDMDGRVRPCFLMCGDRGGAS